VRQIRFIGVALLVLGAVWPAVAADPVALTKPDMAVARKAFAAADAKRWPAVKLLAQQAKDPALRRLLQWLRLHTPGSAAAFPEIAAFMEAHPTWPRQRWLRRRAEEALGPDTDDQAARDWLTRYPPISGDGSFQFARVLLAAGEIETARTLIREAWIEMPMESVQVRDFHRRFAEHIRRADHIARLERLLWDRQVRAARRQSKRVPRKWRTLADARISLMVRSRRAKRRLNAVKRGLRDNEGLLFEEMRWRRRTRKMEQAIALLDKAPANPVRPDRWWHERRLLARWALYEEKPALAYRLASGHRQTTGEDLADAEWLAGWIALRDLNQPADALRHFERMFATVSYPISRARGAYWIARALEALERHDEATKWYRRAAKHTTRFYGQLANGHILNRERRTLPPEPAPSEAEAAAFEAGDLTRATRILDMFDRRRESKVFLLAVARASKTPSEWLLATQLAQDIGRHGVGVRIAKLAVRKGVVLRDTGYPALQPASDSPKAFPDPALIFSVVRQESAFDQEAVSRAGARGLMQLMPRTALKVARQLRIPYSRRRLTRDPVYNLRLGQAYLQEMVTDYDGSLILALAAYNAGPVRVERWLRAYGDPGPNIYAAVDWIESIPFTETRNYVQRVLENLAVYRTRQNGLKMSLTLAAMEPGPYRGSTGNRSAGYAGADEEDGADFAGP
jgi:soluble lytic murein transglycosylase